jgi:hypothetical protein
MRKTCSRSHQSNETKAIIRKAKRDIDSGRNYKEVLAEVEEMIPDSVQRRKAVKSIVDYID